MKVNPNNLELLISDVRKEQYPPTVVPEIALVGRSNVGKSSMINKILNRRNFARVSATPGKKMCIRDRLFADQNAFHGKKRIVPNFRALGSLPGRNVTSRR